MKIRGNKVRFASLGTNFVDCPVSALRAAPHNHNVNAKPRELLGCSATDSARSSGDECCRTGAFHGQIPID
jgi:hypothetical protein